MHHYRKNSCDSGVFTLWAQEVKMKKVYNENVILHKVKSN